MDEQEAIERYIAAYNAFDVDGMAALLHERVSFQNVSGGAVTTQTVGRDAFCSTAEASAKLFTAREQTLTAVEPCEGGLCAKINFTAVLAADLPNGMKAGDHLTLHGETEFGFADGKIASIIDRS